MKVFSPTVLDALAEALRTAYWFLQDLRSFLQRAGVSADVLARLPWTQYKRHVIRELIDGLASDALRGTPVLSGIIDSVVELDPRFEHLARLEDGPRKVAVARAALDALVALIGQTNVVERAERARRDARTEAVRQASEARSRQDDLRALMVRLVALSQQDGDARQKQQRGIAFQSLLHDLFALHDLDPRGSFASPGEQVDGSIRVDGNIVLIEAKWEAKPVEPADVRDFMTKVNTKLDNTLGLMISVSGFSTHAAEAPEKGGGSRCC